MRILPAQARRATLRIVLAAALLAASAPLAQATRAASPAIATDASPEWIAIDNANDVAYVVESHRAFDQGPSSLGLYDALTLAETGRLFADFGPPAVDESRGSAFMVSNNQIVEVNGSSASIVNTYADTLHPTAQLTRLAVGGSPSRVFFVSQTRRVTSGGTRVAEYLTVIDPTAGQIVDSVQIKSESQSGGEVFDLSVDPLTDTLILRKGAATLDLRSMSSLGLTDTWTLSPQAGSITFDPAFRRFFTSGGGDGAPILVRDLDADGAVIGQLPGPNGGHIIAAHGALDRVFATRIGDEQPPVAQLWEDGVLVNEYAIAAIWPISVAAHRATERWWLADQIGQAVYVLTGHETSEPPFSDTDGDSVDDRIDSGDAMFDDDMGTSGALLDDGGHELRILPAGGAGIRVELPGSALPGTATLDLCGFTVSVGPGGDVVMRCGSITVEVTAGSATVGFGDGLGSVAVSAGGSVLVYQQPDGSYLVENRGSTAVTLTIDGVTSTLASGQSVEANAWRFTGFAQPVDALPTLSTAKAGSVIPLKWRVVDAGGNPVTTIGAVAVRVATVACSSGGAADAIEEYAAGGSGLQNLGDGYYQYNWKVPKSYAGSCRRVALEIGDGVSHDAAFSFVK